MAVGVSFVWVGPDEGRLVRIIVTVALFVYFLVRALRHRSDQQGSPAETRSFNMFLLLCPLVILVLIIALTRLAVAEQVWRMQTMVSAFVVILAAILGQVIGDLIKARPRPPSLTSPPPS